MGLAKLSGCGVDHKGIGLCNRKSSKRAKLQNCQSLTYPYKSYAFYATGFYKKSVNRYYFSSDLCIRIAPEWRQILSSPSDVVIKQY